MIRFETCAAVCLLSITALSVSPASAIVIRHDREDARYVELGRRFPAAVSVLPDGTGVLVGRDWVLTAAHVARGVARRSPRVEVAGREIPVIEVLLHPDWQDRGAHDIALLRLARPVENVQPVGLYAGSDEVGQVVTFVGRGDFGTGLTGPREMDRKKRGATNRVEQADDDWIFFAFDEGDAASDLEGVSGPGDSGGPALLRDDDGLVTLGVSVFSQGDGGPGRYGIREGYTRVSTHRQWIVDAMAGKARAKAIRPGERRATSERGGAGQERVVTVGPGGGSELPQTAAGRLVARYIESYNGGDEKAMLQFVAENFSGSYLERRPPEKRLEIYRRFMDELFGPIELRQVIQADETSVTVLFGAQRGGMAEFRFDLAAGPPPKVDGLRVARVSVDAR